MDVPGEQSEAPGDRRSAVQEPWTPAEARARLEAATVRVGDARVYLEVALEHGFGVDAVLARRLLRACAETEAMTQELVRALGARGRGEG